MAEFEKLYTVDEIANMTSLTTRTIRNYLRNGILKGKKIGGQWRFTTEDIKKFMGEGEVLSEMEKEQKQMIMDFVDGVNTELSGTMQICTIVDLYVNQAAAKEKNDELCILINQNQKETGLRYQYNYLNTENKARFILFASPDFIGKAMEIFK